MNEIIINIKNLIYNIGYIKSKLNKSTKVCLMVKANAYGHGIKNVVSNTSDIISYYGVATVEEAIAVRKLTSNNILICGKCLDYKRAIKNNIEISIDNFEELKKIDQISKSLNVKAFIHIKINTGMNRYGVKTLKKFKEILNFIENQNNIILKGVFTHFCSIVSNKEFLIKQQKNFKEYTKLIKDKSVIIHAGGSEIAFLKNNYDMVRIGIGAYGYSELDKNLKPVMSYNAKIVSTFYVNKNEFIGYDLTFKANSKLKIGIVSCGYADGISRKLSNNYSVKIKNDYCKIVGKICMDCFMVIIPSYVEENDTVKIFDNAKNMSLISDTIIYEILVNIKNERNKYVLIK